MPIKTLANRGLAAVARAITFRKLVAFCLLTLAFFSPELRGDSSGGRSSPGPASPQVSPIHPQPVWVSIPGVVDGLTTYALYWKPEKPTGRAVILLWGKLELDGGRDANESWSQRPDPKVY